MPLDLYQTSGMTASEIYSAQIVGDRIRHIRKVFKKSQQDLATMCGKSKSTVSNWEQGLQRPTIPQAMAIADELDLTLDYIYLGRVSTLRHREAQIVQGELVIDDLATEPAKT